MDVIVPKVLEARLGGDVVDLKDVTLHGFAHSAVGQRLLVSTVQGYELILDVTEELDADRYSDCVVDCAHGDDPVCARKTRHAVRSRYYCKELLMEVDHELFVVSVITSAHLQRAQERAKGVS